MNSCVPRRTRSQHIMEWAYVPEMQGEFVFVVPPNQAWKKMTPMELDYFENTEVCKIAGYIYERVCTMDGPDGRFYWHAIHCRQRLRPVLIRSISTSTLVLTVSTSRVFSPEEKERVGRFKVTCKTSAGNTCYECTRDRNLSASHLLAEVRKRLWLVAL